MLIGDDHAAIDRAQDPIQQALGCRIYKRKVFYREEGYDAVSNHPLHASPTGAMLSWAVMGSFSFKIWIL